MKLSLKYLYILIFLMISVTAICLFHCQTSSSQPLEVTQPAYFRTPAENRNMLIAHGGGAINKHFIISNSKEAVESAIHNGFKFIELDLQLSTDGQIVAVHHWGHFNSISGVENDNELSLSEFSQRKFFGQFTPLSANEINAIFASNPQLYLITDKIRDYDALLSQLKIPTERMLVEVFSYEDYKAALNKGIKYPMLCLPTPELFRNACDNQGLMSGNITMLTMPVEMVEEFQPRLEKLYRQGVTIFVYSPYTLEYSNDPAFINKYINKCVTAFYTDYLTPGDFAD